MIKNTFISLLKTAVLVVVVVGGMVAYADWTAAPVPPPGCPSSTPGCNVPINVSSATQTKIGNLGANGLTLFGGGAGEQPLIFNDYYGSPVSGPNKIKLFGSANTLGFGIDASTLDYHSPNMHRWNIGGLIGAMTLNSAAGGTADLAVTGNVVAGGGVRGSQLCIGAVGSAIPNQGCRSTWPSAGSGGGGDDLGNHTATQALNMNNQNIISANNVGIGTASPSAKLDVVGSTKLTGTVTVNTVSGGLTESGRVLTAVNNSGLASWQKIIPRVVILGPFHFRRDSSGGPTSYPYFNANDASWPFCALSSQVSDGSADNSGGGCTIVHEGNRSWTVIVTSPSSDTATDCSIICMKFPTDSDP